MAPKIPRATSDLRAGDGGSDITSPGFNVNAAVGGGLVGYAFGRQNQLATGLVAGGLSGIALPRFVEPTHVQRFASDLLFAGAAVMLVRTMGYRTNVALASGLVVGIGYDYVQSPAVPPHPTP